VYGPLQVLLAAAAAGPNPRADHPPDHLEMAVTEVCELFVDLDQAVKQGKRQTKKRLVSIKHDKEGCPQGLGREISGAAFKERLIELSEQISPFITFREAGFIQLSVTLPELRHSRFNRIRFFSVPALPEGVAKERHSTEPLLDQPQERNAFLRFDNGLIVGRVEASYLGMLVVIGSKPVLHSQSEHRF